MARSASILRAAAALALFAASGSAQTPIPQGAVIKAARFTLQTSRFVYDQPITVHQVLVDWAELEVTWNSFCAGPAPFKAAKEGDLAGPGGPAGPCSADLAALVQRWVDRPGSNLGLLLAQEGGQHGPTDFFSRESAEAAPPRLEVTYVHRCRTHRTAFEAAADAYLWERPDAAGLNHGWKTGLYTGRVDSFAKLSLVRFEIVKPVLRYCASSAGYWKTHSSRGPARPVDPTWALAGERTPFFATGETWLSALWVAPRGDAYWILANQYVAGRLNQLRNGWVPPLVERALAQAERLLELHGAGTSAPRIGCRSGDRALALGLALILDLFNNSGCFCIR